MEKKIERNDPCWCGSGRKYKACHMHMDDRIRSIELQGKIVPRRAILKTPEQIAKIKESAKINIEILDYVADHIKAGISTLEIDEWVSTITKKHGGIPAPLNYEGFPKNVCTISYISFRNRNLRIVDIKQEFKRNCNIWTIACHINVYYYRAYT